MEKSVMSVQVAQDQEVVSGVKHSNASEVDQTPRGSAAAPLIEEARKYRKRAQAAEKTVEQLTAQLAEREASIVQREQAIAALERRQAIDEQLRQADAIDFESARLLTEVAVSEMDEADVSAAVEELRRTKPALFRTVQKRASVSAPRNGHEQSARDSAMEQAAIEATTSGKRSDLLRYLRLRRK
jgi:hypothetical protein